MPSGASASSRSFRDGFSRAIAEALLEREKAENDVQRRRDDDDEAAREAFAQLHFDQPRGVSSRGCRRLAEVLMWRSSFHQPTEGPALSPRFTRGLNQALQQRRRSAPPPSPTSTEADDAGSSADAARPSLLPDGDGDGDYSDGGCGLPLLAYTVYGRIPLRILCHGAPAGDLLGSFRGPPVAATAAGSDHPTAAQPPLMGPNPDRHESETTADGILDNDINDGANNGDGDERDSLAEVWAEESDPSDYSYDDHLVDQRDAMALSSLHNEGEADYDETNTWRPPRTIADGDSKPVEPLTPRSAAEALTALLECLQYSTLSELELSPKVEEELTQLSLTLLLPPTTGAGEEEELPSALTGEAILRSLPPYHWQRMAVRPIHVLRDAAAHEADTPSSGASGSPATSNNTFRRAYLQLLKSMLQVHRLLRDQTATSASTPSSESTTFPPATWLALALLADECESCRTEWRPARARSLWLPSPQNRRLEVVQATVVESVDDLVLLLECAASDGPFDGLVPEEEGERTLDSVVALLIPILRVLCLHHLSSSGSMMAENASANLMHRAQSQTFQLLLNSGLYRQLLLVWQQLHREICSTTNSPTTPPKDHQEHEPTRPERLRALVNRVETALLELSVASPKLLGKYAWRFPGFAASMVVRPPLIDDADSYPSHQAVEWSLLGMELLSSVGEAVPQWKPRTGSAAPAFAAPPSWSECQANAQDGLQHLLRRLMRLVEDWIEQRSSVVGVEGMKSTDPGDFSPAASASRRKPSSQHQLQLTHQMQQQMLAEFSETVDRLCNWPLLSNALLQLEGRPRSNGDGNLWSMREAVRPLQGVLSKWPSRKPKNRKASWDAKAKKLHNDSVGGDSGSPESEPLSSSPPPPTHGDTVPLWKQGAQDAAVDSLRRSLKALESVGDNAAPLGDATTRGGRATSSKAD